MNADELRNAVEALPVKYQDFDIDGSLTPRGLLGKKVHAILQWVQDECGAACLDVGANLGWWSFEMALTGKGTVYAWEPEDKLRRLSEQIYTWHRLERPGFWSRGGTVVFEPEAPSQDVKFDFILALSVLHHVWRQVRNYEVVAEMLVHRMKPHGRLIVELPLSGDSVLEKIPDFSAQRLGAAIKNLCGDPLRGTETISEHRVAWMFAKGASHAP